MTPENVELKIVADMMGMKTMDAFTVAVEFGVGTGCGS